MNYLRYSIISALIAISVVLTYYFFCLDRDYDENLSLAFFQRGELSLADQALEKKKRRITPSEYQLAKGYLTRKLRGVEASNYYFDEVLHTKHTLLEVTHFEEASLNRMLNAYLEKDVEKLKQQLFHSKKVVLDEFHWLPVFTGIVNYHEGMCEQALDGFTAHSTRRYGSEWMEVSFEQIFTPFWFSKHIAHCRIGIGDSMGARQELEAIRSQLSDSEEDELLYLLGLSYIAEAESKPCDVAIPYYRLALSHLGRIQNRQFFNEQKQELLERVIGHTQMILRSKDFEHLAFYLQLVEEWGSDDEVEAVELSLTSMMDQISVSEMAMITATLSEQLSTSKIKQKMALQFERELEDALQYDRFDALEGYWQRLLSFSEKENELRAKFSDLVIQKVLKTIPYDSSGLSRTERLLTFYQQVEDNQEELLQHTNHLVLIADRFWRLPQQREKALHLLKIAKGLPSSEDIPTVQGNIEKIFKDLHVAAVKEDRIDELFELIQAVDQLELAEVNAMSRQEISLQIEDVEYLYLNGRLSEAKKKAEWILKIDPENHRARRILGMIAYYYADYQKANSYLVGIEPANDDMAEAHGVIAILTGDEERGKALLESVIENRPLKEDIYPRLVFGFFVEGQPDKALDWLEKMDNKQSETLAARMYAAFEVNSWNEVLDLYQELASPYQHLDGFRGIVVDSYTALGEEDKAGIFLKKLLRKPPQPGNPSFTPYFQAFKKAKLDQWNRFYVAGIYYKVVKNNLEQALAYFDKIENPTVESEMEKAEVLFQLNRLFEAKEVLLGLYNKTGDNQPEVRARVLPLVGSSLNQLGFPVEALPYYQEYFLLKPEETFHRYDYAKVLMQVKRYDLALQQFERLRKLRALSQDEMLDWVKSLVYNKQFDLANKGANQWLSNYDVPLFYQLKIAELMLITGNKALLDYIVEEIPEPSQRSIKDNQELVKLWMLFGNYAQALDTAQLLEKDFSKNSEGLLVLAQLYMKLSKVNISLEFAHKAVQLDPSNYRAVKFIERYERNPEMIARSVKLLKERVEDNPNSVSLQINYANDLIELAMEAYLAGAISKISESYDLQHALKVLENLEQTKQELPQVYFLLGKTYYLLDRKEEAHQAYEKAIQLDPSYVDVYRHMALLFEEAKRFDLAIDAVKQALQFESNNADIWEQLGGLLTQAEMIDDAIISYKNAIRFAPFDPDSFISLANVYLGDDNGSEAIVTLEGLLSFSPEHVEGLVLMLKALYNPYYVDRMEDIDLLKRKRIEYYDRLRLIDPELARKSLPKGVSLDPETKKR